VLDVDLPDFRVSHQAITETHTNTVAKEQAYQNALLAAQTKAEAAVAKVPLAQRDQFLEASIKSDTQAYYLACKANGPDSPTATLEGSGVYPYGYYWWSGEPMDGRYNHVMTPNSWSCGYNGIDGNGAFPALSRHPGIVNVTLADGSVRAIKNTISPNIWWAIGTRAGGEVISSDSY